MRRLPLPVLALALTTAAAPLWGSPRPAAPPASAVWALSGVDFVPARNELDRLFQGDVAALVAVASGQDDPDPGIRLRAYRSLRHFDGDAIAGAGLRSAVARYGEARHGVDVLYLIAAVQSLGEIGEGGDVALIAPLLDAGDSRDLRAAAARALGMLGTESACEELIARDAIEGVQLVKSALKQARVRAGCDE